MWKNHKSNLNIFDGKASLTVLYKTVKCQRCGHLVEKLETVNPYDIVTKRLANYNFELCKFISIKEVAQQFTSFVSLQSTQVEWKRLTIESKLSNVRLMDFVI